MSDTAHTPGPWELQYGDDRLDIIGSNGQMVTSFPRCDGTPNCEGTHDARLMTAAPSLLEAAKEALSYINAELDKNEERNWNLGQATFWLNDAIAKAQEV